MSHIHVHLHDEEYAKSGAQIVALVKAKMPDVAELKIIKGNGYFYCVGKFKGGNDFVTEGIYTNSMRVVQLSRWVDEVVRVVEHQRP